MVEIIKRTKIMEILTSTIIAIQGHRIHKIITITDETGTIITIETAIMAIVIVIEAIIMVKTVVRSIIATTIIITIIMDVEMTSKFVSIRETR